MTPEPATVLVVDDEESIRRLVSRALGGAGFTVLEAENGASALRIIERPAAPVHLVVSDIHMPVMDGLAFAQEVRRQRPTLPLLFITGREPPGLLGEVLLKPFRPGTLLETVFRLLGHAGRPESARA